MVKFPEVFDVCLFDVSYFFHGYFLTVQLAEEHSPLGPTTQPLEICDVLKRYLPVIYTRDNNIFFI